MKYLFHSRAVWTILLCLFVCNYTMAQAQTKSLQTIKQDDSLEVMRDKIAANGWSFTVGNTWVYDLPKEQKSRMFKRRASSSRQTISQPTLGILASQIGKKTPPSSFDWRNYNGNSYIGEVRNQGSCGSCYSFGACAAAEGTYNFATGNYGNNCIDFSESYITWCLSTLDPYSSHFSGCQGADYDYFELIALTKNGYHSQYDGAALESDCAYSETALTASDYLGKVQTTQFDSWSRIYPDDYSATTEAIKTAIMTYGVVDAAVNVTSAFEAYTGGVFEDSFTTPTATPYYNETTNHAIALVGWDDNPPEGGGGCWILRNSWGSNWGESGYMRIRYNSAAVNCAACYLVYTGSSGGDNVTVTMTCSPDNGGTATPEGSTTVTTGNSFSISATPAAGYTFQSWSAGSASVSFANSNLASTTATVGSGSSDVTITATFTQAVTISVDKLLINLDSTKTGKDKIKITKAQYPWDNTSVSTATLKVETYSFSCIDSTDGVWVDRGKKVTYKSYSKSPSVKITIDTVNKVWTAQISNANVHEYFNLNDGVDIEFTCDAGTGKASYTYSQLGIKTKICYP